MDKTEFDIFCFKVWLRANKTMPRDTGNLADNSFKRVMKGDTCEFYIDLDIAPYAEYLEYGTGTSTKHIGFWENCMTESLKTTAVEYSAYLERTK